MVQFIDVDPKDVPNHREGRRGRVSYPILKSFLETNKYIVQLDRTGMQQSFQSLYSCLGNYIKSHDLPIKLFSRSGELYLMRTDIDEEGNPVDQLAHERATEGRIGTERDMEPVPLDAGEVEKRFIEEVGNFGK